MDTLGNNTLLTVGVDPCARYTPGSPLSLSELLVLATHKSEAMSPIPNSEIDLSQKVER